MGIVASAIAECIHRAALTRPAYIHELEALRQEVHRIEKEVVLMSPFCC